MSGQYKVENSKCSIFIVKDPIRLKICKKRSFQFILRLMKIKRQKVSRFLFCFFFSYQEHSDFFFPSMPVSLSRITHHSHLMNCFELLYFV